MSVDHAAAFVQTTRWQGAKLIPLAGDASARRYFRLTHPDQGAAILMDAPPAAMSNTDAFVEIAAHLRTAGLSAPKLLAADISQGLLLLEDLGDNLYIHAVSTADETAIYRAAVDVLVHLHQAKQPLTGIPAYDPDAYVREAFMVLDWYLPALTGNPASEALRDTFATLVATACRQISPAQVLVLRDYHAENLLWLPERAGLSRVGLLDFQDALIGHPAYDLVSVLEDARRDLSPGLAGVMVAHFLARTGRDRDDFIRDYAILGAQRNLRILGVFARLAKRDGKTGYLRLMPRVWDHLMGDLTHPVLADLGALVHEHLPPPNALIAAETSAS